MEGSSADQQTEPTQSFSTNQNELMQETNTRQTVSMHDTDELKSIQCSSSNQTVSMQDTDQATSTQGSSTDQTESMSEKDVTFKSLGIVDELCDACKKLKWEVPTAIQQKALPIALTGKDIIGLAETGSGKTGAFALPILQSLLKDFTHFFALILTPTRELAFQISEQFQALGAGIGVKTVVIVGGVDMFSQALEYAKRPQIIIATPGRLVDHLENTKGFTLKKIKFLVMDEADRILNMDFEEDVNKILKAIPRERTTYLYSATMTKKVRKLQRASLRDPAKVEVSKKYQTVETLDQYYLFIPMQFKDSYLFHILKQLSRNTSIVFCATCIKAQRTALMLKHLGFAAIALHGKLDQPKRLDILAKFKSKKYSILVATDVASRGLDIPHIDVVINYDIPTHSKEYVHRVGRTARAGRGGKAISFVTQYDVDLYQHIEFLIKKKLPLYPTDHDKVKTLLAKVTEAHRLGKQELREREKKKRAKERQNYIFDDKDDTEEATGVRSRIKKKAKIS